MFILFTDQIAATFGEIGLTNPLVILMVYSPGIAGVFLVWRLPLATPAGAGAPACIVAAETVRWEVETFFEYEKDLLGSDHYQVMFRQAIVRFWTLTACLQCFLKSSGLGWKVQRLPVETFGAGTSKITAETCSSGWKLASKKAFLWNRFAASLPYEVLKVQG